MTFQVEICKNIKILLVWLRIRYMRALYPWIGKLSSASTPHVSSILVLPTFDVYATVGRMGKLTTAGTKFWKGTGGVEERALV